MFIENLNKKIEDNANTEPAPAQMLVAGNWWNQLSPQGMTMPQEEKTMTDQEKIDDAFRALICIVQFVQKHQNFPQYV